MSVITSLPITCWSPPVDDVPSPCACGGVVHWIALIQAWAHDPQVCLACATAGYATCQESCPGNVSTCYDPAAVECATCSMDLTVEGCASCGAEADGDVDPDHAYDLHRERHW